MRLETDRLILRPWEDRDRAPLAAILGDSEVRRFYPSVATAQEASTQIDAAIERSARHGFHLQAAELKATGKLAGVVGIAVIPDDLRAAIAGHPRVEIGWQLDKALWGQGLAPEAASAWLAHGWTLGLTDIVAFTAAINLPSQRVMQKLGMTHNPADDFDHPKLAVGDRLRRHVLYRASNPEL